jgi:hypothetical protein
MLAYIRKQPPMDETNEAEGPYSLVMAPTRELAQQIEEETVKFAHFMVRCFTQSTLNSLNEHSVHSRNTQFTQRTLTQFMAPTHELA